MGEKKPTRIVVADSDARVRSALQSLLRWESDAMAVRTCSDMEGYYLVWNHGVYFTGPPADWGTEYPIPVSPPPAAGEVFPPWGIPSGSYALRARALWYEYDVLGGTETYVPEIYPGTVTVSSEASNINFDLFRKCGGMKGTVEEDSTDTDLSPLYVKGATVTIGNSQPGTGWGSSA